jgi:hypothetical protein
MAYPEAASPAVQDAGPEVLRAVLAGDGLAIDRAFEGLTLNDLLELHESAQFLMDLCRTAGRM